MEIRSIGKNDTNNLQDKSLIGFVHTNNLNPSYLIS